MPLPFLRQHTDSGLLRSPLIALNVTIQSSPSNFERLGDPWDTPIFHWWPVLIDSAPIKREFLAQFQAGDPKSVAPLTCLAKSAEVEFPREYMSFGPISTSQYNQAC